MIFDINKLSDNAKAQVDRIIAALFVQENDLDQWANYREIGTNVGQYPSLLECINSIALKSRDCSHGAAILSVIYVSHNSFKSIVESLGISDTTIIRYGKATIIANNTVGDYEVVAVCINKYGPLPIDKVLFYGDIDRGNTIRY